MIHSEFSYGKSRIDFAMEKADQLYLLEVKGCTLEMNGIGYFPDAPTERGVKHLQELTRAQQAGVHCGVAFVIQMEGITEVRPNVDTHPAFGEAFPGRRSIQGQVTAICRGDYLEDSILQLLFIKAAKFIRSKYRQDIATQRILTVDQR